MTHLVLHPLIGQGVSETHIDVRKCAPVGMLLGRTVASVKYLLGAAVKPRVTQDFRTSAAVTFEPRVTNDRNHSGNEITANNMSMACKAVLGFPLLLYIV